MVRPIDQIMMEADAIIEGRIAQGEKTASAKPAAPDDDVFKLAEALRQSTPVQASAVPVTDESSIRTLTEKIAHAGAIIDTLRNLPALAKLAEFEAAAKGAGHSDEQVAAFLEKKASAVRLTSVFDEMPFLG